MADQIHIDHGELRTHAGKLDDISTQIGDVATQSGAIDLHDGAFGKMMAWLPGVVEHFNPIGSGTISSLSGTVQRTASAVRLLSEDFKDTDQQVADALDHIKG